MSLDRESESIVLSLLNVLSPWPLFISHSPPPALLPRTSRRSSLRSQQLPLAYNPSHRLRFPPFVSFSSGAPFLLDLCLGFWPCAVHCVRRQNAPSPWVMPILFVVARVPYPLFSRSFLRSYTYCHSAIITIPLSGTRTHAHSKRRTRGHNPNQRNDQREGETKRGREGEGT